MQLPSTTTLLLRVEHHACYITFNRPRYRNAMNRAMAQELLQVFDWLTRAQEIRALVLRGAGSTFSSGADLRELAELSKPESVRPVGPSKNASSDGAIADHNRTLGLVCRSAAELDIPIVAAIEGAALGTGLGLACISDIVLAVQGAIFGLPETRLGLVPAHIAPFAVERIGAPATRRLALTGARFDADAAVPLGLVDQVYDTTHEMEQALHQILAQVVSCEPAANRATKRLLRRLGPIVSDNLLDHAAHVYSSHVLSPSGREGVAAFLAHREPNFKPQDT